MLLKLLLILVTLGEHCYSFMRELKGEITSLDVTFFFFFFNHIASLTEKNCVQCTKKLLAIITF